MLGGVRGFEHVLNQSGAHADQRRGNKDVNNTQRASEFLWPKAGYACEGAGDGCEAKHDGEPDARQAERGLALLGGEIWAEEGPEGGEEGSDEGDQSAD